MSLKNGSSSPLVSIIIVTYNSEDDIVECVNSVLQQEYQNIEIIIVDNASKDDTVETVWKNFGSNMKIRLVRNSRNDGYAGGNNLGFYHSTGDLIVILNPDTVVDKEWLSEMLRVYQKYENAGIVCSNVLLFHNPDIINACGNNIHLTGLVFSRFYGRHVSKCSGDTCIVVAPSGASMMFSRSKLEFIGRKEPFDDLRFFMEYSDVDLAIEFLKKDLLCYVSHSSKILHKYKFKMNPLRMYFLETGRYHILGHLTKRTLFQMLPALLLTEMIVWSFVFIKDRNLLASKVKAQIWHLGHWLDIFRSNNSRTNDLKIIERMTPDIIIYEELKAQTPLEGAHKTLNRIFTFLRRSLVQSLSRQ